MVTGFLYQERGVLEFIKHDKVGIVLQEHSDLIASVNELLDVDTYTQ